jgi:hypothetical protein
MHYIIVVEQNDQTQQQGKTELRPDNPGLGQGEDCFAVSGLFHLIAPASPGFRWLRDRVCYFFT